MQDKNLYHFKFLTFFVEMYMFIHILSAMQPTSNPQILLQQIAAISRMERGKLSVIRNGPKGAYYNLQRRVAGRNVTEYVPQDQVPLVQENIESHQSFETLVEEYERLITDQTREERKAGVKKKPPIQIFPSPKKPKSKT